MSARHVRRARTSVVALLACAAAAGGCASLAARRAPPPSLLGAFDDDYGGRHTVSRTEWRQGTKARYAIVEWAPTERYLIARNTDDHPTAPGKWTRIDWVTLDGMAPWTWAFCFSAYDAPSRDSAAATRVAKPETPRTGCNGFPYSRLKRAE